MYMVYKVYMVYNCVYYCDTCYMLHTYGEGVHHVVPFGSKLLALHLCVCVC
jgi:hypothetical protein